MRHSTYVVCTRALYGGFILPLLLLVACSTQPPADPSQPEEAVLDVQHRRFEAMVEADYDRLETMLADDLTYAHSTGAEETKGEFMSRLRSGSVRYLRLEPADVVARVYGDAAVVTGAARMQAAAGPQEVEMTLRFIEVYVRRQDEWKLTAWQSTRLSE
jgi:hypothetical protein